MHLCPIKIFLWEIAVVLEYRKKIPLIIYPSQCVHSKLSKAPSTLRQRKFENAALFPWLGLPSTLIRHENGAFRKCSSNRRNLKTSALRFSMAFRKRLHHDDNVISPPEFSWTTERISWVFRVKPLLSNYSGVVKAGPKYCSKTWAKGWFSLAKIEIFHW